LFKEIIAMIYQWLQRTATLAVLLTVFVATWTVTPVAAQEENGIYSPTDGATVSGVVEVIGRALHPQFRRVQVYLIWPDSGRRPTFLGQRGVPTFGRIIAFDSRRFPDGEYRLRMRVVRQDFNYDEYFATITIQNTGASVVDNNGITAVRPIENGVIRGPVRISGVANDPAFRKWQIDLLPEGDADKAFLIAGGERPVLVQTVLVDALDTTQFPNGRHTLRLRLTRADNSTQDYLSEVIIDNTLERTAANNGFLTPTEGEVISCTYRVLGVADDPQFQKWQLDLVPAGDLNKATFINVSPLPIFRHGTLANLDTTRYPDGEYQLRLRVVHKAMNYDEYFRSITIDNSNADCQNQTIAPEE
jgi:hypothetical protein